LREGSIDDRTIHPVALLAGILLYAWAEYRRSPAVAILAVFVATAGLYFVWFPSHSTQLAELVGIGRGVDLILYIWVCISLIVLLNLHLKLRTQMELVTLLARQLAMSDARSPALETTNQAALTPPSQQRALVG
jgi:small membrane protein